MAHRYVSLLLVLVLVSVVPIYADGPSFHPDTVFKGSSLAGWHTVGAAEWHAENGELIGTSRQGGGWLMLDHSYQDIAFYTEFRCIEGCETGVLFRAERKPDGTMSGVYAPLTEPDTFYRVTLDAQGKITARDKLRVGGRADADRTTCGPECRLGPNRALWRSPGFSEAALRFSRHQSSAQ